MFNEVGIAVGVLTFMWVYWFVSKMNRCIRAYEDRTAAYRERTNQLVERKSKIV